jgi:hypothetical protein
VMFEFTKSFEPRLLRAAERRMQAYQDCNDGIAGEVGCGKAARLKLGGGPPARSGAESGLCPCEVTGPAGYERRNPPPTTASLFATLRQGDAHHGPTIRQSEADARSGLPGAFRLDAPKLFTHQLAPYVKQGPPSEGA